MALAGLAGVAPGRQERGLKPYSTYTSLALSWPPVCGEALRDYTVSDPLALLAHCPKRQGQLGIIDVNSIHSGEGPPSITTGFTVRVKPDGCRATEDKTTRAPQLGAPGCSIARPVEGASAVRQSMTYGSASFTYCPGQHCLRPPLGDVFGAINKVSRAVNFKVASTLRSRPSSVPEAGMEADCLRWSQVPGCSCVAGQRLTRALGVKHN